MLTPFFFFLASKEPGINIAVYHKILLSPKVAVDMKTSSKTWESHSVGIHGSVLQTSVKLFYKAMFLSLCFSMGGSRMQLFSKGVHYSSKHRYFTFVSWKVD